MRPLVRVVTSAESAARDAATIGAGVPSRALMQRAGAAAAAEIALRFRDSLARGALVFAGPGNNGGDAWVVARALAASGVPVRVMEPVPAKTPDAVAERALTLAVLGADRVVAGSRGGDGGELLVVDGLLGTGSSGEPRGAIAEAIDAVADAHARGETIVALDIPSGLDATTGAATHRTVVADLTITFGAIKRGLLVARDRCGVIVAVDIGLAESDAGVPLLVDEPWVAARLPAIPANAHKGTRKKLAIVGGAKGMAGAAILAARAALRSGVGMVKLVLDPDSLSAAQEAEPQALGAVWPMDGDAFRRDVAEWADALVIGPGLGRDETSRALLDLALSSWRGPTLLDADAITLFAGRLDELAARLAARQAVLTPHFVEFARLADIQPDVVLGQRYDIGRAIAKRLSATLLLKGVPTVITDPSGATLVSATGTPLLATGGSGDVLSGIVGTLLAQLEDPAAAAAIGAWIHGRAAERVPTSGDRVRGVSLDDVLNELRDGWSLDSRPTRYPVLAELPAIPSR